MNLAKTKICFCICAVSALNFNSLCLNFSSTYKKVQLHLLKMLPAEMMTFVFCLSYAQEKKLARFFIGCQTLVSGPFLDALLSH